MGKSSGGIRNAGKNPRKSNSINRQVETYSYEYNGEKYTFKIEKNEYKVDRVIEFVNGEKSGRDFNVKSFLENINRSENKNLKKVSSKKNKKPFENTPKEGNFQFENIGGIIYRRDNKTGIVSKQGKAPKFKLP